MADIKTSIQITDGATLTFKKINQAMQNVIGSFTIKYRNQQNFFDNFFHQKYFAILA